MVTISELGLPKADSKAVVCRRKNISLEIRLLDYALTSTVAFELPDSSGN